MNCFTCYSYNGNNETAGNAQANANSANEDQPSGQPESGQSNADTTGGETASVKVNVNTAKEDVLIALAEGNEQVAYDIIAYRQSLEGGIESLDDLREIVSIPDELADRLINSLTTSSSVYMVNSTATANATGISRKLEAVVDRDKSPVEILYFRAGAIN